MRSIAAQIKDHPAGTITVATGAAFYRVEVTWIAGDGATTCGSTSSEAFSDAFSVCDAAPGIISEVKAAGRTIISAAILRFNPVTEITVPVELDTEGRPL